MHPILTRVVASAAAVAFLATTPGTAAAVVPGDDAGQSTARTFRSAGASASDGALRPMTRALDGAVRPEDKITAGARKRLTARGTSDFWLRFGEAADLSAAYGISDWAERGRYVTETLRAAARESQAAVVADLERAGVSYETYWASNAILVEDGSLGLATELAGNAEVTQVRPTMRYALPEPVGVTAEEAAVASATPTSGVAAINADDVWALGATGDGIVVSNIDTGVDRTNSSVAAAYRGVTSGSDYNWYDAAREGWSVPFDGNGHGTHTIGTMIGGVATSASSGNEYAFGVAPDAQWIAANGCADMCLDTALVRSGQWILAPTRQDGSGADPAKRPHVVNNSWGESLSTDPFMEDVVAAWEAAGIFAAFANGNDGELGCESSGAPGSRAASYSVGALRANGSVADFSSRGPGQSGSVKPDITAPGVGVLSAVPNSTRLAQLSGTSMAAPHVAGAVALLWSAYPALVGDVPATRGILDRSAVDVGDTTALACGGTSDDNNVYGEGRLDVLAAYELAQSMEFDTTQDPSVTGTAKVGETLTAVADGAAWSPAASLDHQWRRDGQMISGATETTYEVQPADAGAKITVTVLGTADGRLPTARTSAPTAPVANATMSGGGWISGTVRVGNTVRAKAGTDWPSGTEFAYQWKADGTPISGATGFTHKPAASARGKNLTVTITATRKGYDTVTRTVGGTTVDYGRFSGSIPRIQGTPAPGRTVKAIASQWTPGRTRTTYQWKVNGTKISGATSASYTVPSRYAGKTLTVTVKGYRTGFRNWWRDSKGLVVGKAFTSAPRPTISGTARVGRTLTARPGTWKPGPAGLSYQWFADGRPISGASGKSFTIKGPQYRKRITVQVTARRSSYATTPRLSERTGTVGTSSVTIPEGGWTGVPGGTYTAKAGSSMCAWERWASQTNRLGADYGTGRRIATVKSADWAFWSEGCGTWTKYYPGMETPRHSTWKDGVLILGDQLERGTYVTSGPGADGACYYAILEETTGNRSGAHVIRSGGTAEPMTLTMPSGARAFETAGCSWRRVS